MMKYVAVAAMTLGVLLSSGCSASKVINTGGDTRCKDFVEQDEKKQEISATRLSVSTYCKTVGSPDSKISEAPHG
jgi:acid stress chaperone HdeA